MSHDKITQLARYLAHGDPNVRLSTIKKLKEYIGRGYDKALIIRKLEAFVQVEKK